MKVHSISIFLVVAAGFVVAPTPTSAESLEEGLSDDAKEAYVRGRRYYESGDFERAADALREAYALTPMPMLLYNLALAEWRAGNLGSARAAAERAREKGLPKSVAPRNAARVAAFRTVQRARGSAGNMSAIPRARDVSNSEPAAGDGFGALGWSGVGLLIGGAAGLGTSIWYDARVQSAVERMQRARNRGEEERADKILRDDVRPRQTAGRVFLGSGAVLAAAGVTFVIIDLANGRPRDGSGGANGAVTLRPTVGTTQREPVFGLRIRFP